MRVGRLPIGLVVPALLVGLVGVLATLQYQWLGKVSEAEREQLRRSLDQRAREFADDFDAEISRAYLSLQMRRQDASANDWRPFAEAVDRWQATARFPQMVRAIYLVEASGGRQTLRHYDREARAFGAPIESWPEHLVPVRTQLSGLAPAVQSPPIGKAQFVSISIAPVVSDVPALLIPLKGLAAPPPQEAGSRPAIHPSNPTDAISNAKFWLQWPGSYVLVDIDGEYLRRTLLPALVARHFPEQGADAYRIAVLTGSGTPVFTRGLAAGSRLDPAHADVAWPFFSLRLDIVRDLVPGGETLVYRSTSAAPGGAGPATPAGGQRMAVVVDHRSADAQGRAAATAVAGQFRILRSGWRLVLRHASGSLDVAVSQARRRNMWLSFGILAVLAAGVVLVVVNARRSDQLAARQMDFVANVSHELRTPLAVIRSAAQNLSAGVVSDPGQAKRYGELIEDEGRRLTEMVEQILEYSGTCGDQPLRALQAVDVLALADEVRASCEPLCKRVGMTLELQAPAGDLPTVLADEGALRRSLHNLVMNALKHAPEGGWIGLSIGAAVVRGRQEVQVAVSDRGAGIEAADLAHVFEPFYRGRHAIERQVHGNGLGLSLVKRVAEAHGGSVTVKSVAGEGSTFTLHLPAAAATADPVRSVSAGSGQIADLP